MRRAHCRSARATSISADEIGLGRSGSHGLVALVVAVVTLAWLLAVPAIAADPPAPVSRVLLTAQSDEPTFLAWVNSPDTDYAVACVSDTGVVPTTPAEGRCSAPTADGQIAAC